MNMDNKTNPLIEEFWYISQNKKFQKEIERLRKKHVITVKDTATASGLWYQKKSIKQIQAYQNDLTIFLLRCRASKSKYNIAFQRYLEEYIFTNNPPTEANFMPNPYPDLYIEVSRNRVLITISADYDSTIDQINGIVNLKKKEIKKAQEKLAGSLLKPSKDFYIKKVLWEACYLRHKNEKEIEKMIEKAEIDIESRVKQYKDLSKYEIKKVIKAMDIRIHASFE